ncbi:hydroxylaminobenzene mutase HabB [Kalymmatonema gypsitolerans NIES-4073]|nr:hydroxylaminobenzene mutase HabB [Scytonema sp. NIES-4073]
MSTLEKTSQSNLSETVSSEMNSIQSEAFKRSLLWHGIFICLLGFVAGLFIPLYANPRAGLATHLLGITQGVFIAVIGLSYPQLKLPLWVARANFWMLLISAYVGMIVEFLAAAFGLSRMFLITAMGLPEGIPWLETSTEIAIKNISILTILSCFIVLFGLRQIKSGSTLPEKS